MDTLKQLGLNIQSERKVRSISQEKLAEYAGLHRTYVGMVERGERNITIESLKKIALALDLTIHELTYNL